MTIDIQILSTPDISLRNEVINLSQAREHPREVLSAASFLVLESSRDSLVLVLRYVCEVIEKEMPEYAIWLFVGNSAWQPDTRVVRYRKLWGALRARGVEVLGGSQLQEIVVESNGKLKFFGALRLSALSTERAVDALLEERCSYIAALPIDFDIRRVLEFGWSGSLAEDLEFYSYVCERKGIVLKRVGGFDDRESGILSISSPELIVKMMN